jgi:hypothetical protein
MKIWLDNIKAPPDKSWVWIKIVEETRKIMKEHRVEGISLTFDLGEGLNGYDQLKWMVKYNVWPTTFIRIHTMSIEKRKDMIHLVKMYKPKDLKIL